MAAQTFLAPSFASPAVHLPNFPGVIERSQVVDLDLLKGLTDGTAATTLEANDKIKFFKLQGGSKIVYGRIDCEDLDTNTVGTLDLVVTDGTTTKYLIKDSTCAQTGTSSDTRDAAGNGVVLPQTSGSALGFVIPWDETDWYCAVIVSAAPTGMQNDFIKATIGYTMALENGDSQRDFPTSNPS